MSNFFPDDSDDSNDLLFQATCAVLIDGQAVGTAWLVSDEGHLLTAGHLLGTDQPTTQVEVQFVGDAPRKAARLKWMYDEKKRINFAALKLTSPIGERRPLPVSLAKSIQGSFRLCGDGTTIKSLSQLGDQFLGSMYLRHSPSNALFRLRSSDFGQQDNSGGAIFSNDQEAAIGILTEVVRHPFDPESDMVLAIPLYRVAQLWEPFQNLAQGTLLKRALEYTSRGKFDRVLETLSQAREFGRSPELAAQISRLDKQLDLWRRVRSLEMSARAMQNTNSPNSALGEFRLALETACDLDSGLSERVRVAINLLLALENRLHQEEVLNQSKQLIADVQDVALKNRLVNDYLLSLVKTWHKLAVDAAWEGFITTLVTLEDWEAAYVDAVHQVHSNPNNLKKLEKAITIQKGWRQSILDSIKKRLGRAKELQEQGTYQKALDALAGIEDEFLKPVQQRYSEIAEDEQIQQAFFESRDLQLDLKGLQKTYLELESLVSQIRDAYVEGDLDRAEKWLENAELLDRSHSVKFLWGEINNLQKMISRRRQKERRLQVEEEMNKAEVGLHLASTAEEIASYLQALVNTRSKIDQLDDSESETLRQRYSQLISQLKDRFKELDKLSIENLVSYQVQLLLSAETVPVAGELEVTIELKLAAFAEEGGHLLNIPANEVNGNELSLMLDAPGFQFLGEPAASLPLLEPASHSQPQRVTFRLRALRPADTLIAVDLYCGSEYEGVIKQQVTIAGISEESTDSDFANLFGITKPEIETGVSYQVQLSALFIVSAKNRNIIAINIKTRLVLLW